jgi:hypothetical protein
MAPIRWTQRDFASWHGDLDDRLVVDVVRLGPETTCQVALWAIRGGFNGASPSFDTDAYGSVEEAKLMAEDVLLELAEDSIVQDVPQPSP